MRRCSTRAIGHGQPLLLPGGSASPTLWTSAMRDRRVTQARTRREPERGDTHVRLCVQRRLTRSAGDRPAGVRARRPVAWMAGRRETECSEAHRRSHRFGMVSESPGRNVSERRGGPESAKPRRPSLQPEGAKAAWTVAGWLARRLTPAGWERQHGDQDAPSNWRSPPRPAAKSAGAR